MLLRYSLVSGGGTLDQHLSLKQAQSNDQPAKRSPHRLIEASLETVADSASLEHVVSVCETLINGLPEQVAVLDGSWTILAANAPWNVVVAQHGYDLQPGDNYLEFCRGMEAEGHAGAAMVVDAIARMEREKLESFHFTYAASGPSEGREFEICISRIEVGGRELAMAARYDVTELMELRRARRTYGQRVLQEQAAERQRIAREIHDSTMQPLVCIGLSLGQLKRTGARGDALDIIQQMEELISETQREIRSIAFVAHPPSLDGLGLVEAVRLLVNGFGQRTALDVSFEAQGIDGRLPQAAELALYRAVQEGLMNVHRHAEASEAAVRLLRRRGLVHAVIVDNGRGMSLQASGGVGLSSMRGRLAELGGRLTLVPKRSGMMIVATLPANVH